MAGGRARVQGDPGPGGGGELGGGGGWRHYVQFLASSSGVSAVWRQQQPAQYLGQRSAVEQSVNFTQHSAELEHHHTSYAGNLSMNYVELTKDYKSKTLSHKLTCINSRSIYNENSPKLLEYKIIRVSEELL